MTRNYQKATSDEIRTIIDTHKKYPKKSQADIADEIGRVQSYVYYIIKGYEKGNKRIINLYNGGTESFKGTGKAMHVKDGKVSIPKPGETVILKTKVPVEKKTAVKKTRKSIVPGKHAAIPHKLSEAHKSLDRKELEILKLSKTSNEYIVEYYKQFGFDKKTNSMLNDTWKRREDILKYEDDKLCHAIVKPQKRVITEQIRVDPRKATAIVGEDEAISNLSNKISVLTQYFKEVIELEQDIVTSISKMSEPKA